jgi:hypothetical protein
MTSRDSRPKRKVDLPQKDDLEDGRVPDVPRKDLTYTRNIAASLFGSY